MRVFLGLNRKKVCKNSPLFYLLLRILFAGFQRSVYKIFKGIALIVVTFKLDPSHIMICQEFIDAVVAKTKEILETSRRNLNSQRQALLNQKMALEGKRNKLEDALLEGTIDRVVFKRKHAEIEQKIANIDSSISELESQSRIDVDLIEEVLAFSRNIYESYIVAPEFLKRHYLRFFFEKIYVKNKQIFESSTNTDHRFSIG